MALDFNITHETADLSEYASTNGDGVSVSTAAAMTGTYGLEITTTGSSTDYATADVTDESSHDVNLRFKFDPNSLTMTSGDEFWIMIARNSSGQSLQFMTLNYNGTTYRVRGGCTNDSGTNIFTGYYNISDAPQTLELAVRGATTDVANDGTITVYIDDVSQSSPVTNLDLFNRGKIADVDIGVAAGIDGTTSGTMYFDDFAGDMTGTYIGLVGADPMVTGPALIYSALGYREPMSAVTAADSDNDLSDIRYDCTSGQGIFTIDDLDTALISAGTNNTNDVTISGTNAQLLAAHARVVYIPQQLGTDSAVRVTATDDTAGSDSLTFSIEAWDFVAEAATQTILNDALATLTATSADPVEASISVKAIDSANLSGTDSATISFTAPPITVNPGVILLKNEEIIHLLDQGYETLTPVDGYLFYIRDRKIGSISRSGAYGHSTS